MSVSAQMSEPSATAVAAATPASLFEVNDAQGAYESELAAARALAADDVLSFPGDASLLNRNVQIGLAAIAPHRAWLEQQLPHLDWRLVDAAKRRAMAVIFADIAVQPRGGSTGQIARLVSRGAELRRALYDSASSLVRTGHLPKEVLAQSGRGKGLIPMARNCVVMAAAFRLHANELAGKTPITVEMVDECASVGSQLLTLLKPKGARKAPVEREEKKALRDRCFTLLFAAHQEIRRAGMWLWIDRIDDHVPPLSSRLLGPRKPRD